MARVVLLGALAMAPFATVAPAHAADPPKSGDADANSAAAEALFQEGRSLAEAKRYAEACPKFLASQKLAPAVGTLLNLADCYERNNQLASAWARFEEAMALAKKNQRPERERVARERAEKLEPRLPKVVVTARDRGADVKLDGGLLDASVLGTAMPVDPGRHTIEANARGKKPFSTTIEITEGKRVTVEIPALTPEAPTSSPGDNVEVPKEEGPHGFRAKQRTIGLIAAGVGVVGLGVGAYLGWRTSSLWKQAKGLCNENAKNLVCPQTNDPGSDGAVLATRAQNYGTGSTVAFIAGGVLVAGGAVLFFTAPRASNAAASGTGPMRVRGVGIGPGSVAFEGTF